MLKANEYLDNMYNAIGNKLIYPESIYTGREGHLRLAREMGVALNDFDKQGQKEILGNSYGSVYVRCCNLNPLLDNKEWINEMVKSRDVDKSRRHNSIR